ncbi:MAG TPA: tetratricopeptide repeat protein [Thermoanaerobaculia bacterium]|nr:tetratricopeptide repeat protein [Thermoanaerobaculia bacterium]
MANHDLEEKLRDLKKRVESEPRSRFFVPLAEEYRRAGRLPEAIRALENGLAAHPGYVAARVALGRALLETGRIEESVEAFSKALSDDPSNLVAAKALGDIHLSRGEPMEALKRYLRFRAVSGDRRLDDIIAKLRNRIGPASEPSAAPAPAPPVLPPSAFAPPAAIEPAEAAEPRRLVSPMPPLELWPAPPPRRETDPFDITSVPYAPAPKPASTAPEPAEEMLSRDVRLDATPPPDAEIRTRRIRLPEATWPFEPASATEPAPTPPAETAEADPLPPDGSGASGRTLAELYFEQGHDADAIRLADDLLVAIPGDEGLRRLREEAARRLAAHAPAAPPGGELPPPVLDPGRERRLAKVRLLNQWLDAVSERSRA